MPDEIKASPAYLESLAVKQDNASAELGTATAATDGIGKTVWITHGCYVGAANKKIDAAESARKAAGEAMQAVSTALAQNLRKAGLQYAGTDLHAAANLDKQVLDGT